MKLLTVRSGDSFHPAVLVGAEVLDLVAARLVVPLARLVPVTMPDLLASGAEGLALVARLVAMVAQVETAKRLRNAGALAPFAEVPLGPVVPNPTLLLSGSMNSRGHTSEMNDDPPTTPCAFHKVQSALCASGDDIVPPPRYSEMIDWEGELCVVIGTRCHQVSIDRAMEQVAGFTLLNDVSARDFVSPFINAVGPSRTAQAWERNVLGKNFPTFAPLGPVIVTRDEWPEPFAYHMQTLVNGEVMQSSTQEDLVFGPAEMISYFSQFYVFSPGDIISMGSPPGVGMARRPQVFLRSGDTVEVRVDWIGSLRNRVAAGRREADDRA